MNIARRQVLAGGLAAAVPVCHLPTTPHHPHTPAHPPVLNTPRYRSGPVRFGANSLAWKQFAHAVPKARYVRQYWHGVNKIEPAWPRFAGALTLLSFEPYPRDLLHGRLDAKLRKLAATAPRGSVLVPWYEAGPANPRSYGKFVTATAVRECQGYLHHLLRHTNVRVGSIICGPADQLEDWMAGHLKVYSADIDGDWFMRADRTFETDRFEKRSEANLAIWRRKAGVSWPQVMLAETNSSEPEWFALVASWHAMHGGADLLTFWDENRSCQGTAAKPWPPSAEVISQIRRLSEIYDGTKFAGGAPPG